MSITINLTPTEEARLSTEAMQNGLATEELVQKLLREHLTAKPKPQVETVQARLRQWQEETRTETLPATSVRELFARWAEEDAQKTNEEIAADEHLWQDYRKGIDDERRGAGMRTLFDV